MHITSPCWFDLFLRFPPECPVVTTHSSGSILTSRLWSATSYRAPSGNRETRLLPASAAPVRSLPWCPSVLSERAACHLANESRPRGTRCWTWRAGTSLTTWLKPTPVSSEPGRFKCSLEIIRLKKKIHVLNPWTGLKTCFWNGFRQTLHVFSKLYKTDKNKLWLLCKSFYLTTFTSLLE